MFFLKKLNNITENILNDFKSINSNIIISQWNEDPFIANLPDTFGNLERLKKFIPIVNHSFITTNPSALNLSKKNKF